MTEHEDIDARLARLRRATGELRLPGEAVSKLIGRARESSDTPAWTRTLVRSGRRALLIAAVVPAALSLLVLEAQVVVDELSMMVQQVEWLP